MNCREFKEQFEDGRNLSKKANAHIASCLNCENYQIENLQLTQMISSLSSVKAPKDFEFGFKAKLANAELNKPTSPIWQILRYLLPMTAAVLIFGFVIINSNIFDPTANPQVVADQTIPDKTDEKIPTTQQNLFDENQIPTGELVADTSQETEEQKASERTKEKNNAPITKAPLSIIADNKSKVTNKEKSDDEKIFTKELEPEVDSQILNRDSALREIPQPIYPPGFNPNKKVDTSPNSQNSRSFTASDILSQLGISISNNAGQLRVNSILPNSAGAKSGVKVGDIIIAMDGQKLSNNTLRNRKVQGKSLTLKRENKTLNITIKN